MNPDYMMSLLTNPAELTKVVDGYCLFMKGLEKVDGVAEFYSPRQGGGMGEAVWLEAGLVPRFVEGGPMGRKTLGLHPAGKAREGKETGKGT